MFYCTIHNTEFLEAGVSVSDNCHGTNHGTSCRLVEGFVPIIQSIISNLKQNNQSIKITNGAFEKHQSKQVKSIADHNLKSA